jgi:hypothetical protein
MEHSNHFINIEDCLKGINSNMKYKNAATYLTFLLPDNKILDLLKFN